MKCLHSTQQTSTRGLSLVEVAIVSSILLFLARALIETSSQMGQITSGGGAQALLQEQGQRALGSILGDLRRSGSVTINAKDFPYVFDDGNADAPFDDHDHVVSNQEATINESDFGTMREMVLVLPSNLDGNGIPDLDMDGNGWPEFDGDGDGTASESAADYDGIDWDPANATIDPDTGVVWSHGEISYTTVTEADGVNYLERRTNTASPRRVARDIELVQFDTWASSAFAIPMNSIRVRIFLRRRTDDGTLYRHRVEAIVKLRNTEDAS
ncbi:MAG: hypothetical protein O2816_03585 [Planctomycetota bacterium]|nr:hypothetical protein [Planctomycetota bacterium]